MSTLARRMRCAGLSVFALVALAVPAAGRAGAGPPGEPVRRACPDPAARGQVTCLALVRTDVAPLHGIQPQRKLGGLGPVDLRDAYRLPAASGGQGATVAVVNAFDDPEAESDLAVY